ncbi:Ser/Thr protein phosphatase [Histomonas meleagridis]|uniref:Ser/Thr protein phosphatase n=1 Tax=Histomonas meleagridis TaxID=135588 RepID=UPI00355A0965|nr:Ser/Thr protein phosphatase [Histomonas meleagridis]KAH0798129.1 Ser/Thr protein phosphatase [Histomonas meleagridis]
MSSNDFPRDLPEDIDQLDYKDLRNMLSHNVHLKESFIIQILDRLSDLLIKEPNVLYLQSPITVCGDIHGQLLDLFQLFDAAGGEENSQFLFLGDYVDRGYCSLETFAYLAFLKIRNPNRFWLLRGNHESKETNQTYGLFNDCIQLYGHSGIWFMINDVFSLLPIAAVIDKKIFCVHGGLSPKINLVDQIDTLQRRKDIEKDPIISDLTWSDPDEVSKFISNRRGNGYVFGPKHTLTFLYNNQFLPRNYSYEGDRKQDINHGFIARSHQLTQNGYVWLHDDNLVIVWSAPNYMYKCGNDASIMKVYTDKAPEFIKFDKDEKSSIKPEDLIIEYFA